MSWRGGKRSWVVAVTLCFLVWASAAWILLGPDAGHRVMPGNLSTSHAALESSCGNCHSDEAGLVKGLLSGISHSHMALVEGRRCLDCHKLGHDAFRAHSLPPETLEQLTRSRLAQEPEDPGLLARLVAEWGLPQSDEGELACAICHREHQGRGHNLKAITNEACQACHVDRQDHFPARHPQLGSYPYGTPSAIVFDHQKHRDKNFPEEDQPFECLSCHETSGDGQMLLRPFEESCTSCHHHDAQLFGKGKMEDGVALVRAWGLDLESLEAAGLEVTDWPADGADFEDGPTALTWILLSSLSTYEERAADRALLEDLDLSDLSDASRGVLEAAQRMAAHFRELMLGLAECPELVVDVLSRAKGLETTGRRALRLLAPAAWRAVRRIWFPDGSDSSKSVAAGEWGSGGRWYHDEDTLTLFHVPIDHADPLARLFHEGAVRQREGALVRELQEDERCFKCHSISTGANGQPLVNWWAKGVDSLRPFTRFDHRPHLLVAREDSCLLCHKVGDKPAQRPGPQARSSFRSEFLPMSVEDCSRCHHDQSVNNGCADCHNYHVGMPTGH